MSERAWLFICFQRSIVKNLYLYSTVLSIYIYSIDQHQPRHEKWNVCRFHLHRKSFLTTLILLHRVFTKNIKWQKKQAEHISLSLSRKLESLSTIEFVSRNGRVCSIFQNEKNRIHTTLLPNFFAKSCFEIDNCFDAFDVWVDALTTILVRFLSLSSSLASFDIILNNLSQP